MMVIFGLEKNGPVNLINNFTIRDVWQTWYIEQITMFC